jgi:Flp pilus assembly protein TadG
MIIFLNWKKLGRREDGAVSVEFALMLTLLLLIVGGVIDFGHYLYLRQVATNASREGARQGSRYAEPRITASAIQQFVQQKYGPSLGFGDGGGPTVAVVGAGGASGTDLTVTVTGSKTWFLLEGLIDGIAGSDSLHHPSGVTVMKLE